MTTEIENLLDKGCVFYLRLPYFGAWRLFRRVVSKGNPIITSLHGDWGEGYRKARGSLPKRMVGHVLACYVDYICRHIVQRSEAIFCTGEKLHQQYGHLAKRSVVIANFLHRAEDIRPPETREMASPCRILFVGQLEERKGVIYLLKSLRLLADEGIKTRLTIIGKGPLRHQLEQSARELGLAEAVGFIEYIQFGRELLDQYRKADIFVLPSIAAEGMPKVLMEALSQGVPVISTDIGSSRQLLGDGAYGIVVSPQNEKSIAEAIRRLMTDDDLRNTMIDKGLEAARNSTRDVQSEKIKKVLQEVIPNVLGTPAYIDHNHSNANNP
jgi:glycosyltransferase involved in cell wall biosynthesis